MKISIIQDLIDLIRGKKKFGNIQGKNNNVFLPKNKKDIKLTIRGNDNYIKLSSNSCITLRIFGNNNTVIFDESITGFGADITFGTSETPANNCTFKVGKGSTSNGISVMILDNGTNIEIGDNCMFSAGIQIWASDAHAITDYNGNLINLGKEIIIGNNVWVGISALILKNSKIPDNCVIGAMSTVNKQFNETNCILAGTPAKIVKKEILWHRERPNEYINK